MSVKEVLQTSPSILPLSQNTVESELIKKVKEVLNSIKENPSFGKATADSSYSRITDGSTNITLATSTVDIHLLIKEGEVRLGTMNEEVELLSIRTPLAHFGGEQLSESIRNFSKIT